MYYEDYLRPKRILMTADTMGGVWTYAVELARVLVGDGLEVGLATMGALLQQEQREEIGQLAGLSLFESSFKLEWMEDPWEDIARAGSWLLAIEDDFRPDVIHLNGYAHGCLPWKAPTLVVGHSCVISWWEAVHGEQAPAVWDRYYLEIARGLAAADAVAAPSKSMFWLLNKNYGPILCGRVIYNGRDPWLFHSGKKEPVIFTAGRLWDGAKNLCVLEKIADRLPWPVYAAGPAREKDSEGSGHCVLQLGPLYGASLSQWYSRSSIFVLPAKYEPFGLCILEAALSGCALVLGDIPSLREIWAEGALFVHPDDSEGLEASIKRLILQPELLEEMAKKARKRALEFSPEHGRRLRGDLS